MTILMVHNYYRQSNPSGENVSFDSEVRLLRERGHRVILYTRQSDEIEQYSARDKLGLALDTIWSREAVRSLRNLISMTRPSVAHFQNTFPLISPAAYRACSELGVPVVQTLRNYRLHCPSAVFYRDGRTCEDCLGRSVPWPGVVHACYRGSRAATAVVAGMLTIHRALGTWTDMVDLYITLTEFARQKLTQGGIPPERIKVKPNFVHPDPGPGDHGGGYAIFVGRLGTEKGVETLLRSWELLSNRVPLKIVGDGPLAGRVAAAAQRTPGLEWLGRRTEREAYELMGDATVLIFPSKLYETFGRVAVEAFAKGTPVIASDLGAVAEVVEHGRTGLLFAPGDPGELAARVDWAWGHPREMLAIGREARREYETKYGAESNYLRLVELYDLAGARCRRGY
jgi:glycosyltransferase involved in cell wall biosynthesis